MAMWLDWALKRRRDDSETHQPPYRPDVAFLIDVRRVYADEDVRVDINNA